MADNHVVVGQFAYADDTQEAIVKLRDGGFDAIECYSPLPNHDLEDEMYKGKKRSPVRRLTMLGGVAGCLLAFLFTSWMSVDWPLRTSAKTLISIPSFVIIAFECTILLGAISTLLAMLGFARIPNLKVPGGYRPTFTEGTFGLTVRVAEAQSGSVKEILEGCGAKDVEVEYVR